MTRPSFRRTPAAAACPFCGVAIPDMMLGFLDHVDQAPVCKEAWAAWRDHVRREAGGT